MNVYIRIFLAGRVKGNYFVAIVESLSGLSNIAVDFDALYVSIDKVWILFYGEIKLTQSGCVFFLLSILQAKFVIGNGIGLRAW